MHATTVRTPCSHRVGQYARGSASASPSPHPSLHSSLSPFPSSPPPPSRASSVAMEPVAKLSDDLIGEILLHLPQDDPACLLRISLVCKRWRCILADPAFRRRYRALHRDPPVIGLLRVGKYHIPFSSRFVPIHPGSRRPAGRDLLGWRVLDCRHGRALFMTQAPRPNERILDFIVWDPLTNKHQRLPRPPPMLGKLFNAAVLCAAAAGSCDHCGCHGDPFRVVFIYTTLPAAGAATGNVTSARVYSSETGDWSELTSVQHPVAFVDQMHDFITLVGDVLYFHGDDAYSISYQLDAQRLSVIDRPPQSMFNGHLWLLRSIEDNGRLGFVGVEEKPSFCIRLLWRETSRDRVARWVQGRTIKLQTLLPEVTLPSPSGPQEFPNAKVVGVAEGTDVIFVHVRTHGFGDVYMIQLNSGRAKKVVPYYGSVFPYTSFCIPV
ncbi:hypothetical protein PR202_gb25010 [Eleusine coracana subsp. coracana]|uniref:F-box domain-containing protein n=1 Tax=Eleusine coracana subsp. coracana TaxID=191504 RepID=A0AAV5FN57_ELECO|nr:hypothetical protein PR202_gb25010 [Eleusine coracana subsp. coracana]